MRTKIGFLGLVIAGLVIGSVVSNNAVLADATTPVTPVKHHHHHHHIHGKITAMASDGSSITVMVHHHHKKGSTTATATTEEKPVTITVTSSTKIVNDNPGKTGLAVGEHVSVTEKKHVALEITIGGHGHHHKKKPAV